MDAVRVGGDEPPDPFVWFTLACDEAEVDALVAAVQALPMVVFARRRTDVFVAANISYGTNPDAARTLQIQPVPQRRRRDLCVAGGRRGGRRRPASPTSSSGWRLDHEELVAANIRRLSVFGSARGRSRHGGGRHPGGQRQRRRHGRHRAERGARPHHGRPRPRLGWRRPVAGDFVRGAEPRQRRRAAARGRRSRSSRPRRRRPTSSSRSIRRCRSPSGWRPAAASR